MSEFQIERPAKEQPPKLGLDASGETDADGGGGTTFIFHGGRGGGKGKGQQGFQEYMNQRPPPVPIGPPVELSLSSAANAIAGGEPDPEDYGSIGAPVLPPAGMADAVQRELGEAKALDDGSATPPAFGSAPGGIVDIEV
jgi:hypothetical protein